MMQSLVDLSMVLYQFIVVGLVDSIDRGTDPSWQDDVTVQPRKTLLE